MKLLTQFRSLLALTAVLSIGTAYAAQVDSITMTPNGSFTTFTIAGTYGPGTPTTAFSSANTPYLASFTLATTPDPASFDFTPSFGIFAVSTNAKVNGIDFANSEILFFTAENNGGLALCLSDGCVDPNTVCDINGCVDGNPPSPNSWELYSAQLFTGTIYDPTFLSGEQDANTRDSYVAVAPAATPEPDSLALLGTGLLGFGPTLYRKLRPRRAQAS